MLNIKTKLRRAFTIVELVVVIAVIAALAAILIPTFANVINAANESADTSLVKNLNTIFSSEQTITSSKPSTMSEALELAAENGYNVDKLTPSSSGDIVWDQTSNRFLLIDEEGNIVYQDGTTSEDVVSAKYQLWYIASSEEDYKAAKEEGYSVYLACDLEAGYELSASAGVDVGDNSGLVINYTSTATQKVIFNTNGGTLTIDNANATVYHYGDADVVTITAVDTASYYPYGNITTLTVVKGHIYLQSTAVVGTLNAKPAADSTSESIILDADAKATITEVVIDGSVTTGSTTATAAVKYDSSVFTNVTYTVDADTQKTLSAIGEEYFDGGLGTSSSPFLISTYEQLYKMFTFSSTQYCYKQTADIVIPEEKLFNNSVEFNGIYDGDYHSISVDKDLYDIDSVSLFKVGTSATIKNLDVYSAEYCLMSVAVSTYGCTSQDTYYIKLSNVNTYAIDDVLVHVSSSNVGFFLAGNYYSKTSCTGTDRVDIIFENCTNYASLSNEQEGAVTGIFMGGGPYIVWSSLKIYVSYINCTNKGNLYGSNAAGLLIGNCAGILNADVESNYQYITVQNVKNTGIISAMKNTGGIFSYRTAWNEYYNSSVTTTGEGKYDQSKNELEGLTYSIYVNNGTFEIYGDDLSENYTYKLMIGMPNLQTTDAGSLQGRSLAIDLTKITATTESDQVFVTSLSHKIYTYSQAVSENVISEGTELSYTYVFENQYYLAVYVDSDGVMYIIMQDNAEGETYPYFIKDSTTGKYTIYAYNANGTIAGYTTYTKTA